jgi:ribosomal protein L11 methyltransferase
MALVSERDWVRETQSQFGPFQASPRLWVVPSWAALPPDALIPLRLDPGVAFGTGSHPTTRLCLHWLDATMRGGEHVLDYGCGSGILTIAAIKLGAARAVGVDIDPLALTASRENARLNRVAAEFHDPAHLPADFRADLVVANILARPLMLLAPVLVQALKPGGRLALAGILGEQAEAVAGAYRPALNLAVAAEEENWVLLAGEKSAP